MKIDDIKKEILKLESKESEDIWIENFDDFIYGLRRYLKEKFGGSDGVDDLIDEYIDESHHQGFEIKNQNDLDLDFMIYYKIIMGEKIED